MSEQELIVYCAGTKIFTTWETLTKLPKMVELDAEKKLLWRARKEGKAIFIDRDPAYFAALVKKLRGYPLTASEQVMARVELSFWGGQPEENDFGETVVVIFKDIEKGSSKKKTFHFYQATLDLLPGLQNFIRASVKKENGIPRVNVSAALWLPLRELQVSLVTKAPLYALHWHHLTSVGLSKHIPIHIGASQWEEKPIDYYSKTLKLSWQTVEGKKKKSRKFSFSLNDVPVVSFSVEPAFKLAQFLQELNLWRVIDGGDSLRSASGSCQITWICYPQEDEDDDDSSSSESSSSSSSSEASSSASSL